MCHELRSSKIKCTCKIRAMYSLFQIFTLRLHNQTKYNYKQHQVRLSAGMSQSKSTKINLSSSVYLNPQGMWAILILQLSTKSHMQKRREQWPWEASQDAPVTLLPQKTAATTVMETAIKHTQVAESNLHSQQPL